MNKDMQKTILVYDDEESILEVIKIILEENDYIAITSSHAENIAQDIQKYNPSLILLDIWMKGISGNEVAQQVKSKPETKHIPIILVSALNEAEKIAKESAVNDFLRKPFDMDFLLELVKKHIL